jgi:serine/threonine-protein kinase
VKVLHAYLASSPDVVARFVSEGYIANAVGHRSVVQIADDDVGPDGAPYLVMERLDGEPLPRMLDRHRQGIAPSQMLAIADEVLDVLATAHARGVVHRDVKPDNVFVTTSGSVKVLDFGIAGHSSGHGGASSVTVDGAALGTPQYMPPEQARGRWSEVDAQSDVWALGATMFRMLTGKLPREARTTSELIMRAMTERIPRLADVAPWVPASVAAVVDRATELEKKDRWRDARAMQLAVREAAAALGKAIGTRTPLEQEINVPVPEPRRRGAWLFAAAAVVAALGIGAAFRGADRIAPAAGARVGDVPAGVAEAPVTTVASAVVSAAPSASAAAPDAEAAAIGEGPPGRKPWAVKSQEADRR